MSVGVIAHLDNPSVAEVRSLAIAAEDAGADWLGVADAFWWRDVWILLAEAARVTTRLVLGPMVTNPYLRHRFHTVSALATLQELAPDRVMLGVAAGGSEVSGAAGISRRDAKRRIEELVGLVRSVAGGGPLDDRSGRRLDVPLGPVAVTVAGRGDAVLRAAGRCADRSLLWAIPDSDLDRSVGVVRSQASERVALDPVRFVWAPLVAHDEATKLRARVIAAYGILNASSVLRERWSVDDQLVDEIRRRLVGGGAAAAADLVPAHVVDDIVMPDGDVERVAARGRSIGAVDIAVPAESLAHVADRVAWAQRVAARLG